MTLSIESLKDWFKILFAGGRAMPEFLEGVDISQYQGEMRWNDTIARGAAFAYARACIGSQIDNQFETNSIKLPRKLTNFNFNFGYYFPIIPDMNWSDQANLFCDLIEDLVWTLPPAIDIEREGWYEPLPVVAQIIYDRLKVPPAVYTTGLFWNEQYPEMDWSAVAIKPKDLYLWIAIWSTTYTHPWVGHEQYKPISWDDYMMWQWQVTNDGPNWGAESERIDRDKFPGTQEQLDQLAQSIVQMRNGTVTPPDGDFEQRLQLLEAGHNAHTVELMELRDDVGMLNDDFDGVSEEITNLEEWATGINYKE